MQKPSETFSSTPDAPRQSSVPAQTVLHRRECMAKIFAGALTVALPTGCEHPSHVGIHEKALKITAAFTKSGYKVLPEYAAITSPFSHFVVSEKRSGKVVGTLFASEDRYAFTDHYGKQTFYDDLAQLDQYLLEMQQSIAKVK